MKRNWKSNGRSSLDERELIVRFPAPALRFGVDLVIVSTTAAFVVLPALFCLWLLALAANQLLTLAGWGWGNWLLIQGETSSIQIAGAGLALLVVTLPLGLLIARVAAHWWRRFRGAGWLRLSTEGFEVNDHVFTPRRHEWGEIDMFMLVAAGGHVEDAPTAPPKTYSEAFRDGGTYSPPTLVGFRCLPERRRRRSLASKLLFYGTARDGTKADGTVMGYWDRPADEAVDLLNEWLARYRAT